jgi:Ni2+-binding GTPase involved in maturation of urease and hydrogenase
MPAVTASMMDDRFASGQAWPTMYVTILGPVGSGKSVVMKRTMHKMGINPDQHATDKASVN